MREIIEVLRHPSFGEIHKGFLCFGDFHAINPNELSIDIVQHNYRAVSLSLDEVVAPIGSDWITRCGYDF